MAIPTNPNMGQLDFNHIFQRVYDEVNDRLRVEAIINTSIGDVEISLIHTEDSVRLGDGTNFLTSTTIGSDVGLDVNVISPINVNEIYPYRYRILNLSMPLADTEYSLVVPNTARRLEIRPRESKGPIRLYETSGGSLYYTVPKGSIYETAEMSPSGLTIYLQTAQAGTILEIIYWEI